PDFDLSRKCKDRVVADDKLDSVIAFAIAKGLPVEFILNGGIWADAICSTPEWDVNDHLEDDTANCHWTQRNEVLPDDCLKPLPVAEVNRLAHQNWKSWDEVDPPRTFPGEGKTALPPGTTPYWDDPWFIEWDSFRKHVVGLHYDELASWVHATGIPRDRIFSA